MYLVGDVLLCGTTPNIVAIDVAKREAMWNLSFDRLSQIPLMNAPTNEVLLPVNMKNNKNTDSLQLEFLSYTPELFKSKC